MSDVVRKVVFFVVVVVYRVRMLSGHVGDACRSTVFITAEVTPESTDVREL